MNKSAILLCLLGGSCLAVCDVPKSRSDATHTNQSMADGGTSIDGQSADRCELAPDAGTDCSGGEEDTGKEAWYFDGGLQRCRPFLWKGCGGQVPFEALADCHAQCDSIGLGTSGTAVEICDVEQLDSYMLYDLTLHGDEMIAKVYFSDGCGPEDHFRMCWDGTRTELGQSHEVSFFDLIHDNYGDECEGEDTRALPFGLGVIREKIPEGAINIKLDALSVTLSD